MKIAASMDSRGYARSHRGGSGAVRGLMVTALIGAALGAYALMDGTTPRWLGIPLLAGGALAAVGGSILASRRIRATRYRPDRWGPRETLIIASGIAAAALTFVGAASGSSGVAGWSAAFLLCAVLATAPIPVVMSQ